MYKKLFSGVQWVFSRVAVVYIVLFIFCLTCVDTKMLDMRIKIRHLNDAIPDFSNMIVFSKVRHEKSAMNWRLYKDYFELILHYMPDDVVTGQLLGYVDFYEGQEQKAIDLFKGSLSVKGQALFWSNYNLGVIYYKKGMWPQSADYLFKAITSNLQLTVLLMENSMVYKQIFSSNAFHYSLGDEIKDAQAHAYILLLSSLQHMGQYEKMLAVSNLALENKELSDQDAFYYYTGLAFFDMGQMEKAFLFFQKSLMLEKNDPDVYFYIANIYQNAGKAEQARYFLQASYLLHQKNDPRFPYEAQAELRFF